MKTLTFNQIRNLVEESIEDLYNQSTIKQLHKIGNMDDLINWLDGMGYDNPERIIIDSIMNVNIYQTL